METTTLLAAVLIALGTLLPTAATWLQRSNRTARRQVRQLLAERAQRDEGLLEHHSAISRHNFERHASDGCPAPFPPLPPHLTEDDDEE